MFKRTFSVYRIGMYGVLCPDVTNSSLSATTAGSRHILAPIE